MGWVKWLICLSLCRSALSANVEKGIDISLFPPSLFRPIALSVISHDIHPLVCCIASVNQNAAALSVQLCALYKRVMYVALIVG